MPELVPLEGRFVHLLPLSLDHAADLLDVALDDRGSFSLTPVPWDETSMVSYLERALAHREAGDHLPYATWSVESRRIVGTTRFYDLTSWDWSSMSAGPEAGRPARRARPYPQSEDGALGARLCPRQHRQVLRVAGNS